MAPFPSLNSLPSPSVYDADDVRKFLLETFAFFFIATTFSSFILFAITNALLVSTQNKLSAIETAKMGCLFQEELYHRYRPYRFCLESYCSPLHDLAAASHLQRIRPFVLFAPLASTIFIVGLPFFLLKAPDIAAFSAIMTSVFVIVVIHLAHVSNLEAYFQLVAENFAAFNLNNVVDHPSGELLRSTPIFKIYLTVLFTLSFVSTKPLGIVSLLPENIALIDDMSQISCYRGSEEARSVDYDADESNSETTTDTDSSESGDENEKSLQQCSNRGHI